MSLLQFDNKSSKLLVTKRAIKRKIKNVASINRNLADATCVQELEHCQALKDIQILELPLKITSNIWCGVVEDLHVGGVLSGVLWNFDILECNLCVSTDG